MSIKDLNKNLYECALEDCSSFIDDLKHVYHMHTKYRSMMEAGTNILDIQSKLLDLIDELEEMKENIEQRIERIL